MRRPGLASRIQRVEAARSQVEVAELARKLAETGPFTAMELIIEAERIATVCHRQGITSTAGIAVRGRGAWHCGGGARSRDDAIPGADGVKRLGTRVQMLERQQPVGCATCRWWDGTIVVSLDEEGDETGRSRPDECPDCGRHVPVERVLQIVGVDRDVV